MVENPPAEQPRISGLEAMLKAADGDALPPVDMWNPPYCGDIGMEIRADGTWFYQNSPIGRARMVKMFSRILRCDPDGSHFLVTPVEKVDVKVADAPFRAVEMDVDGSGAQQVLTFRTNVDDVVRADAAHPMWFAASEFPDADGCEVLRPYLRVRGRLDALIVRSVYYDLVDLAEPQAGSGSDQIGIWSGGTWFPIAAGQAAPA